MHHPGPLDPKQTEHAGDRLDPFFGEHADHLIFGAGRIGERTEQIEDSADAELAPHFRHVTHGGMMDRREHEAEPALLDAARDGLRRALDIDSERREHVGRARARGDRPVAVLGDRHAGASHHEGGAGRDVVRALGVAAGAAGVDRAFRRAAPARLIAAHSAGSAGDLIDRLSADAKPHEQRADLRIGSPRPT